MKNLSLILLAGVLLGFASCKKETNDVRTVEFKGSGISKHAFVENKEVLFDTKITIVKGTFVRIFVTGDNNNKSTAQIIVNNVIVDEDSSFSDLSLTYRIL